VDQEAQLKQKLDAAAKEIRRLDRIVGSVRSKTALDIVAEKMVAQDQLQRAEEQKARLQLGLQRVLDERLTGVMGDDTALSYARGEAMARMIRHAEEALREAS
jgi:hypothetical protein